MKRHLSRKVFILLLFVAFALSSYAADNNSAPDFQLTDLNDQTVSLCDYKDKKTVVLLFWTTWCPYCREELKTANQKYAGLAKNSIELLAVNVGEAKDKVESFIRSRNFKFKVLLDRDGQVASAYGLMGVPSYFVIDKSGQVISAGTRFPKDVLKELIGQ